MTAHRHGFTSGIHVRGLLLALALYCLSLSAWAVNSGNIGRASVNRTGSSASVTPGSNSGGSTIPVSPSVGGWTQAGNYGFPTGATGPTIGHTVNGEFVVGGSANPKYPFTANYAMQWKDLAKNAVQVAGSLGCAAIPGIGVVAMGACTAGISMALPFIADWLNKAGGRVNPDTKAIERMDPASCPVAPCYKWHISTNSAPATIVAYRGVDICGVWLNWAIAALPTYNWEMVSNSETTSSSAPTGACWP